MNLISAHAIKKKEKFYSGHERDARASGGIK